MTPVKVVIVDDNEDMRSLVRLLFDLDASIEVVDEATSATDGVASWRRHRPEVVVLDYLMENATGLDAARDILGDDPSAAIVLFSEFLTDEVVAEAGALGIKACVSKDDSRRLAELVVAHGRRD